MGLLDHINLPDEDEARRLRPLKQKWETPTRLDVKAAKDKDDEKKLDVWRKEVRKQQGMKCRACKRKLVVTLELVKNRSECHHIVGRAFKPLRYDRRNGLHCCPGCHQLLERNELVIVQDKQHLFTLEPNGKWFINADAPLECKRPEELTTSERNQR